MAAACEVLCRIFYFFSSFYQAGSRHRAIIMGMTVDLFSFASAATEKQRERWQIQYQTFKTPSYLDWDNFSWKLRWGYTFCTSKLCSNQTPLTRLWTMIYTANHHRVHAVIEACTASSLHLKNHTDISNAFTNFSRGHSSANRPID